MRMDIKTVVRIAILMSAGIIEESLHADVGVGRMTLPQMAQEPRIDGVIDAAEWRGATGAFGFCRHSGAELGPVESNYRIGRTADKLFFAGCCAVGPAGLIGTDGKKRMSPNGDDNYELVFVGDASKENADFCRMIVNYSGALLANAFRNGGECDWAPTSVRCKSCLTNDVWMFELSVDLAEIGFRDTPHDCHAVRICHAFRNVGAKLGYQGSVIPNDVTYFTANHTMPLVFDDHAASVALKRLNCDGGNWRVALCVENNTDKDLKLAVFAEGRPEHSQPGSVDTVISLCAGQKQSVPIGGPIIGDERVAFKAFVKDSVTGTEVFNRAFSWHPNGGKPEWVSDEDGNKKVKFRFAYYPSYDKIRLAVDLSKLENRPEQVDVSLLDAKRMLLAKTHVAVGTNAIADAIWGVPDLKSKTMSSGDGRYFVELSVPGRADCGEIKEFRRDVFDWEGFKGGTSSCIPAPYHPVCRKVFGGKEHVLTILKDHEVGELGLWDQVIASGKKLLAAPMRVTGNRALLSAESSWDVDGMMVWTLHLRPGHYEPMSLEIPLLAERAKLMHACADGLRHNYAGEIPAGVGRVWDSSKAKRDGSIVGDYLPYVWVGGPLRGLAVFGDNDKGWVVDSATSQCQEIARTPDGTILLKLNLVQRPCDISSEQVIRIGFLATPTKPMEEGWRGIDIGHLFGSCWYWGAALPCDDLYPYDGTDEYFRKLAEAKRTGKVDYAYVDRAVTGRMALFGSTNSPSYAKGKDIIKSHYQNGNWHASLCKGNPDHKLVFYTNARGIHLGSKEGLTFCDEWAREEFAKRPYAYKDSASYSLDPCRSYRDFAAFWWEKMLLSGACDYLYWDDVFAAGNADLVGTEAYRTADGSIQCSQGIFNMRALVRRGAVLEAEHGLVARRNWVHMTNTAIAPVCSFAGVNYDWEDFCGDTPLQKRYSREYIQAATIGRQFGNKVSVMGYFATKDPKSEKLKWLERTGTGACLTHELLWRRVDGWNKAYGKLRDWGYCKPDAQVWNYWDEDVAFPARIDGGKNAALAMAREGEAILVVADWEEGGSYRVKPNLTVLGIKEPIAALDHETGTSIRIEDGVLCFHVQPLDYKMIRIFTKNDKDNN